MLTGILFIAGILNAEEYLPEFKIKFDNEIKALGKFASSGIITTSDTIDFTDGIEGNALLIGDLPSKTFSVFFQDNFPFERGSLSFWISSKDWNYNDNKHHIFLKTDFYKKGTPVTLVNNDKPLSSYNIYKYANPHPETGGLGIVWMASEDDSNNSWNCNCDAKNLRGWKTGSWHNITITWGKKENNKHPSLKLFIDGESISICNRNFNFSETALLTFGTSWGSKGKTAIDEIELYAKVLTEDEIVDIYNSTMEKFENNKEKEN